MNRLNAYRFVRTERKTYTEEDAKNAIVLTNFDDAADAHATQAKYEFIAQETEKFAAKNLEKVEISVNVLPNGNKKNSALVFLKGDAKGRSMRVYGTGKTAVAPMEISGKDLAKLVFGFCKSGDDFITETMETPAGLRNVTAPYCNISALL